MSKKTLSLIVGLILLTVVLVFVAIQNSKSSNQKDNQTTQPQVTTQPTQPVNADTVLFMTPVITGNTANVAVTMQTGENDITAVQMEIAYDPQALSFVSIAPSPLFAQGTPLLNTVDRKNGRITYALGLSPQQAQQKNMGEVNVATIVFNRVGSASGSASTELEFLPKSLVSSKGITQSVLKETRGTILQFGN